MGLLRELLDQARRTPSAGNSQGVEFLVLDDLEAVRSYWDVTLPKSSRKNFAFPGLLQAPALVIPFGVPKRYLDRYSEPDKQKSTLGKSTEEWLVPYWLVDASFAAMALQLLIIEAGLRCCFFGLFENEIKVKRKFGVPEDVCAVGTIAIGHPSLQGDRPGASIKRDRRNIDEIIHQKFW